MDYTAQLSAGAEQEREHEGGQSSLNNKVIASA